MSTSVWTGAGSDGFFEDPANWQGNSVPQSGADLVFNEMGTQSVVLTSNVTVGNIYVAGHYSFLGESYTNYSITLDGDLSAAANSTVTFNNTPIDTAVASHFTADDGATLTLNDVSDPNGLSLDRYGDGTLDLEGTSNATWNLLDHGTTILNGTQHRRVDPLRRHPYRPRLGQQRQHFRWHVRPSQRQHSPRRSARRGTST